MTKRRMSDQGVRLLTEWEGFEVKVYKDSAGLPTVAAHLNPDVAVAVFHELPDAVGDGLGRTAACMAVDRSRFTTFSTQKLVNRHSRLFPLDVP